MSTQTLPVPIWLNCLVLGDDPRFHIFLIKIAQTESVGDLKKLIKEDKRPEFDAVATDYTIDLILRKVANLTADAALESNVRRVIEHKLPLLSLAKLSKVFSSLPEEEHLHVVVQRPPAGISHNLLPLSPSECAVQKSREAYAKKFPQAILPMLQENNSFTIGWEWPRSAASIIPTTLLHPIFGQFIDDCESHEPTKEDNDLVMALSEAMCNFFDDEDKRASKFWEILQEHRINLIPSKIQHTKYETDSDIQYRGFRYAILEAKNELGAMQAEPHMQAISYYIWSTLPFMGTKHGRFPCILITLFGPHIDFSGAVWIEHLTIQVLSAALPLLYHHTDTKMHMFVMHHVGAFRKSLWFLNEYCKTMDLDANSPTLNPDLNPVTTFPFQHSYTCIETSSMVHFRYIYQMDNTKLIFTAKTTNKKMICVKFVRRYLMDVHKLCASEDFAPVLYGLDYLPGGWYMVVMELIENDYICLWECSAPHSHQDEIAQKLECLHQNGLVHGDIRDMNTMVKKDGSSGIKLVDFDWSGKIGEI
ncbi:hypothetical protein F4604DRAFT_1721739 [Suillus subluteus]|nr:hypothetical protein F4604DRAFT_1721739 [Suillus subluteus]